MYRRHRVDACDLEHADDAWICRDEVESRPALGGLTCGFREDAHAGRVEEGAAREVDHHTGRVSNGPHRFLEPRRRGEIELAVDVHDGGTVGRRLDGYVKLVWSGQGIRV